MTKAKYKLGDYLSAPGKVYMQVRAVIENDNALPVYALQSFHIKNKHEIEWVTEFELSNDYHVSKTTEPDFKRYDTLAVGDTLKIGDEESQRGSNYATILARVGNMVLLSQIPHSHEVKQIHALADQIKELTDGQVEIMDEDTSQQLKKHGTLNWARQAAADWLTTEQICLMNWPIVRED